MFLTETKPTYEELEQGSKELEKRLSELNRAGEHLEKSYKELELLVEDRTFDLREASQMLKKEREKCALLELSLKKAHEDIESRIAERTQELRMKNDQLQVELDERIMMTDVLHENEQQFRALVSSIPGAVYRFRIDSDWTVEFISDVIEDITAYPASKFRWNPVQAYRSIIHPEDRGKIEKDVLEGMDPMKSYFVEYRIIDGNGRLRWFSESGQAVYSVEGEPLWLDGTIYDISDRKFAEEALQEANKELQRLAMVDGLTQIANRRRFDEYLNKEWRRMKREGNKLALILCDIDFFKPYNDNYGHQEGDICLQRVAQTIHSVIKRPGDLAARYGGEEFAVILPNTHAEGAVRVAERIREKIQQLKIPHAQSSVDQYVTLSMGVSCVIHNQEFNAGDLVNAADDALYKAKAQGRNRVIVNADPSEVSAG